MKNKKQYLYLFLYFCILYLCVIPDCHAQGFIVDHNCTNISVIPDTAIAAGSNIRIEMRTCSIMQDCLSGLALLHTANTKYDRDNFHFDWRGHPGTFKQVAEDLPYYKVRDSVISTFSYVDEHYNDFDYFSTYFYDSEGGPYEFMHFEDYRDGMLAAEAKYPGKKFVWCTSSISRIYAYFDVQKIPYISSFNATMRDYCRNNGKVLYDLADIECHDPDGNKIMLTTATKYGTFTYEAMPSTYTVDQIHANTALGRTQLAKAYWWLMARIAGWSGTGSAPAAPTGLQITSTGYTDVGLSWLDNSTDEEKFVVYRSSNKVTYAEVKRVDSRTGTGNLITYTDTGLNSGTTYWYYVKATNAFGDSPATSTQTVTTLNQIVKPAAPSNLILSGIQEDSITLSWTDNSNNEEWFKVYRSVNGTNFDFLVSVGTPTYTNNELLSSTTYWYCVTAGNVIGESTTTVKQSAVTLALVPKLVAWYKFDDPNEINTTTAHDSSGYDHNGAILGGPVQSSDIAIGSHSLLLDGTNDQVYIIGTTQLSHRQGITFCSWVNIPDVSGDYYPVSMEGIYSLTAANSTDNKAGASISIGGSSYTLRGTQLETNKWHHLCLTYDSWSGKLLFYIDDVITVSSTTSGLIDSYISVLRIGRSLDSYFKGKIDDVRIYNYALSSGQVMSLYNEASTADTTPPSAPASVSDGLGSDINSTFSTSTLSANWANSADAESGIAKYYFAIGTTPGGTSVSGWTDNGDWTYTTKTGLALTVGTTYYFSVKAENGVGLQSGVTNSNGQYVVKIDTSDTTPPSSPGQVRDGTGVTTDITYTTNTTTLSINWDASTDTQSGILRYYFAIGTSPGAADITGWTDNGQLTTVTKTGLTLTVGATYYFSVKSENGVGLQSAVTSSNGQYITVITTGTTPPIIPPVITHSAEGITAYPNPFSFTGGNTMKFVVNGREGATIKVYTIRGSLVKSLSVEPGASIKDWDGTNEDNEKVARGIYIYKIAETNGDAITGKLAVTK